MGVIFLILLQLKNWDRKKLSALLFAIDKLFIYIFFNLKKLVGRKNSIFLKYVRACVWGGALGCEKKKIEILQG